MEGTLGARQGKGGGGGDDDGEDVEEDKERLEAGLEAMAAIIRGGTAGIVMGDEMVPVEALYASG